MTSRSSRPPLKQRTIKMATPQSCQFTLSIPSLRRNIFGIIPFSNSVRGSTDIPKTFFAQSIIRLIARAVGTPIHSRIFNPTWIVQVRHGGHGDSKFDSVYVNQGLRWRTDFFDLPKSSMNGDYRRQNPDKRKQLD